VADEPDGALSGTRSGQDGGMRATHV
jgi:hypothetical protein